MKISSSSLLGPWCLVLLHGGPPLSGGRCAAFRAPRSRLPSLRSPGRPGAPSAFAPPPPAGAALRISTLDADAPAARTAAPRKERLLAWRDALPLALYAAACLAGALLVSTYEDYDATHTRPTPASLRRPTARASPGPAFLGAATRGLGWGAADARAPGFADWYGDSATSLASIPGYNEILGRHREERVPRWRALGEARAAASPLASRGELRRAVQQLYRALDELQELKVLADDYRWEDLRARLAPAAGPRGPALPAALEYAMDALRSAPAHYAPSAAARGGGVGELPALIGFDWGSCGWRHCGAKADAQEALAELAGDAGLLEPFECRFVLDVVERSIRDVLAVVPDDLRPTKHGAPVQPRPYEAYVPQTPRDGGETRGPGYEYRQGSAYEYAQAASEVRNLSLE